MFILHEYRAKVTNTKIVQHSNTGYTALGTPPIQHHSAITHITGGTFSIADEAAQYEASYSDAVKQAGQNTAVCYRALAQMAQALCISEGGVMLLGALQS